MRAKRVKIVRLKRHLKLPQYQHSGDSCIDLTNAGKNIILKPFSREIVPTGIKVAVPDGFELQIRPRSGLALKKGITVLNAPGTIDSGYRGEVCVILHNSSNKTVKIKSGERIAQSALCKVEKICWQEVKNLNKTKRNEGGFGSTGR
ncbi:MAG: dUTP diphosphatase [Elusimicrobia bacterium]|nr:dUTP diphosphatase [Elusimicrobiota bacterium]